MIYRDFKGCRLSMLGFGTMRLPLNADKTIDQAEFERMTDYAIEHGVNYFDTAYPYHGGLSELAAGKALKKYPRDSFYLATKYPGHQISQSYDPAAVFEDQLKKCGVDYFDFYLLHNVYENSVKTYLDPKWKILDYFKEQKRLGRIKHLGFSSHGGVEMLKEFLDIAGADMEFCQIQLNYLDWTLQNAKEKCELLAGYGIPVWVMEPVRGGKLAKLSDRDTAKLKELCPGDTCAAVALRFLQDIPGVTVVLSGMSDMTQLQDNVKTFWTERPLNEKEKAVVLDIAEGLKDAVPCTACRYCTDSCPMQLDIPKLIAFYNELRTAPAMSVGMRIEAMPEDKRPSACLACGACAAMCPQHIDIPGALADLCDRLAKMPSWSEMCRQRDEAQRKLKEGK